MFHYFMDFPMVLQDVAKSEIRYAGNGFESYFSLVKES